VERKKVFILLGSISLILMLALLPLIGACAKPASAPVPAPKPTPAPKPAPAPPAKEVIKVGAAPSLSGRHSAASESEWNAQQLWVEQINAEGGLYVKEYGKKIPLKLIYYDNKSSEEETIKIYEKLITVDKCDLLLPPTTTGLCVSIVPTMEKHHYPMVVGTAGSVKLTRMDVRYWWTVSLMEDDFQPGLANMLSQYKDAIKKVAVLYTHLEFPLSSANVLRPALEEKGFDIVMSKDYPAGVTDMTETLIEVKSDTPDAVIVESYPADCFLIMKQAMEVGLDAKFFYFLVGPGTAVFRDIYGDATEGICGQGSWDRYLPYPGAKEFYDSYVERWGERPDALNSALGIQVCGVIEGAVEKAGTLDWETLRDVIANSEFMTPGGPVKFVGVRNVAQKGTVIQYQNGELRLVWPPEVATAEPMIPKPPWPK